MQELIRKPVKMAIVDEVPAWIVGMLYILTFVLMVGGPAVMRGMFNLIQIAFLVCLPIWGLPKIGIKDKGMRIAGFFIIFFAYGVGVWSGVTYQISTNLAYMGTKLQVWAAFAFVVLLIWGYFSYANEKKDEKE